MSDIRYAVNNATGKALQDMPPGEYLTFRQIQQTPGVSIKAGEKPIGKDRLFEVGQLNGISPKFSQDAAKASEGKLIEKLLDHVTDYAQKEGLVFKTELGWSDPDKREVACPLPGHNTPGSFFAAHLTSELARQQLQSIEDVDQYIKASDSASEKLLARFGLQQDGLSYEGELTPENEAKVNKLVDDIAKDFNLLEFKERDAAFSQRELMGPAMDQINQGRETEILMPKEFSERAKAGIKEYQRKVEIYKANLPAPPKDFVRFKDRYVPEKDLRSGDVFMFKWNKEAFEKSGWQVRKEYDNYTLSNKTFDKHFSYSFKVRELTKAEIEQFRPIGNSEILKNLNQSFDHLEEFIERHEDYIYPTEQKLTELTQEAQKEREAYQKTIESHKSNYEEQKIADRNRYYDEKMTEHMVAVGSTLVTMDQFREWEELGQGLNPEASAYIPDLKLMDNGNFQYQSQREIGDSIADFNFEVNGDLSMESFDEIRDGTVDEALESMGQEYGTRITGMDYRDGDIYEEEFAVDMDETYRSSLESEFDYIHDEIAEVKEEYGDFRLPPKESVDLQLLAQDKGFEISVNEDNMMTLSNGSTEMFFTSSYNFNKEELNQAISDEFSISKADEPALANLYWNVNAPYNEQQLNNLEQAGFEITSDTMEGYELTNGDVSVFLTEQGNLNQAIQGELSMMKEQGLDTTAASQAFDQLKNAIGKTKEAEIELEL